MGTTMHQRDQHSDIVEEDEFLLTALKNRRSISRVSDEEPPERLIAAMLEAATWAPNTFVLPSTFNTAILSIIV